MKKNSEKLPPPPEKATPSITDSMAEHFEKMARTPVRDSMKEHIEYNYGRDGVVEDFDSIYRR